MVAPKSPPDPNRPVRQPSTQISRPDPAGNPAGDSVRFVDTSPLLPKMTASSPAYQAGTIGRDAYRTATDTPTIVVPNVLLVRKDLDANVACAITRTVFDKRDALAQANPAARGISLDTARKTEPVPLHRGAEKALKDLGAN